MTMTSTSTPVRRGPPRSWLAIVSTLMAVPWAASAAVNFTIANNTVTATYGDDSNTSTLAAMGNLSGNQATIVTALNNNGYTAGNGWNITFAGAVPAAAVAADLSAPQYQAWVGSQQPTYTDPASTVWGGFNITGGEGGGAYLRVGFAPGAADPLRNVTYHWIQAFSVTYMGNALNNQLDAGAGSPYYDTTSAAGNGNNGYFADIPFRAEQEYELNTVAVQYFSLMLAVDSGAGGGFAHNLTLYAGYSWGYTYSAVDTPVPEAGTTVAGSLALALVAGLTFRGHRSRTSSPAPSV